MRAALANARENLHSSLWFVPGVLVLGGVVLSSALLLVDALVVPDAGARLPWLFGGTAGAARNLLSTVAGSLINVVAVSFSVTLVAVNQAATQYTPRIFQIFTRDRGNQVVLGTCIGTFTYALLVMRQIREAGGGQAPFVPALAVSGAIALALVSVGLLVYFIHHTIRMLEVTSILASLGQAVQEQVDRLHPQRLGEAGEERGEAPPDRPDPRWRIQADRSGYLRRVDERTLADAAAEAHLVLVRRRIGDHVLPGAVLAEGWAGAPLPDARPARLREAFVLDRERSLEEDPLFGIRQIVDIAVKALSPGINDPTTAEQCLARLGDVCTRLVDRRIEDGEVRLPGGGRAWLPRPGFADYVDEAFTGIRRAARETPHVTLYLLNVLEHLAERAPTARRAEPLRGQVDAVLLGLPGSALAASDRALVDARARRVLARLPAPGERRAA